MTRESLESKIRREGDPLRMLRSSTSRLKFPYPDQHTNWQEEQEGWTTTATLFDQSHHMTDVYFKGPDVKRLLSDTGTNSFATFGRDKAKQFAACNEKGQIVGTAVLFGLEDDEVSLVGPAAAANWVQYHAETGGYDVEVTRDERTPENPGGRLLFRYEIEGPRAWDIVEKAAWGTVERIKFFRMTEFVLAGVPVRALSHTMAAVPGAEATGLEIWGPAADGPRVLDALLAAGSEFGMVRGGALAYYSGSIESGYLSQPAPAVYTGDHMKAYREWLPADSYEGTLSVGGSYVPDTVDGYYVTPFDYGYSRLVKFDHDFIGRSALEAIVDRPRRRKVWLRWHPEDVLRVYASSLTGANDRAKSLDTPLPRYARTVADAVYAGDRLIGVSRHSAYTVNVGAWTSIAVVDEDFAVDGAEATLLWGEPEGGATKSGVERHAQTPVRVTLRTAGAFG